MCIRDRGRGKTELELGITLDTNNIVRQVLSSRSNLNEVHLFVKIEITNNKKDEQAYREEA